MTNSIHTHSLFITPSFASFRVTENLVIRRTVIKNSIDSDFRRSTFDTSDSLCSQSYSNFSICDAFSLYTSCGSCWLEASCESIGEVASICWWERTLWWKRNSLRGRARTCEIGISIALPGAIVVTTNLTQIGRIIVG